MSRIFWDTNLFIYLFEDYGKHSEVVAELRAKMLQRGDDLITSALTLGEILTGPQKAGNQELCRVYEESIRSTAQVISFDVSAARRYATLRTQTRRIAPPDAIQLACAAAANVDLFLTNDSRLHGLTFDGIHFITSVERAPL
jgi:predicted nucleic acid-binding protein